jgi:hypothetical protein
MRRRKKHFGNVDELFRVHIKIMIPQESNNSSTNSMPWKIILIR